MALQAKDAERYLIRLEMLIRTVFKPTLEERKAKAPNDTGEAIQKQGMVVKDLEDLHIACTALLKEHAEWFVENTNFVESLRSNILNEDDTLPKELFTEQAEIFNKQFKKLSDRYGKNQEDYVNKKS